MEQKLAYYKINKISQPEYFIQPKPNYSIKGEDCEIKLMLSLTLLLETREVNLKVIIQYCDKNTQEELMNFSLDSLFGIQNFEEVININKENHKVDIPDNLLLAMLTVTIGAARGMIALVTKKSYLEDIFLPVYDAAELVKGFKAQHAQPVPPTE